MQHATRKGYHQRRALGYPARQALTIARCAGVLAMQPDSRTFVTLAAMADLLLAQRTQHIPNVRAVWESHYRYCRAAYRAQEAQQALMQFN